MGTTYYVSVNNGNNNNQGTQLDKPLRTIQAAINKAQGGDTIQVREGVYAERLHIQKVASPDAPLTLSAYRNEKPVVNGKGLRLGEDKALLLIQQSQDIVVEGMTFRNSGGYGVQIHQSSRIVLRGCAVNGSYAGGILAVSSEKLLIEGTSIWDNSRRFLTMGTSERHVALVIKTCKEVVAQDNKCYENTTGGILVLLSRDVKVRRNTCYDNRSDQISITSSIDVDVDANLVYHTGRRRYLDLNNKRPPGIVKNDLYRYMNGGPWAARHIRVHNNIVVAGGYGFRVAPTGGALRDFSLAHNTFINCQEPSLSIHNRRPTYNTFIENNLVYCGRDDALVEAPATAGTIWRNNLWSSFPGQGVYNPDSDVVVDDPGLREKDAPVEAGKLAADVYQLVATSPAINTGFRNETNLDYWGSQRDGQPDIGAHEFPGGPGDVPEDEELPPAGERVSEGLLVLYDFREGQGNKLRDVGGYGDPLDLTIQDTTKVTWQESGLLVQEPAFISSERPATKIIDACRQSNEVTLEAWIQPANNTQDGPARILSLSTSKTERNATLAQGLYGGQRPDLYVGRLRTTQSSANGLPAIVTPEGSAAAEMTHVVYTRSANGRSALYLNGQVRAVLDLAGDFSNWDTTTPLLLANELSADRPWLGELKLVAIYGRALSGGEALHNYDASLPSGPLIIAGFTVGQGQEYGIAPHTVDFDSSESTSEVGIASYLWEFGDGQTSTQSSPSYTYQNPGVYTVKLTIADQQGTVDSLTRDRLITVVAEPLPPLPMHFSRFVLVDITESRMMAFGIQYPDLRCVLLWNEDPFHMLTYARMEQVQQAYEAQGYEIVWVDSPEIDE